jgi:hypothetical protein
VYCGTALQADSVLVQGDKLFTKARLPAGGTESTTVFRFNVHPVWGAAEASEPPLPLGVLPLRLADAAAAYKLKLALGRAAREARIHRAVERCGQ